MLLSNVFKEAQGPPETLDGGDREMTDALITPPALPLRERPIGRVRLVIESVKNNLAVYTPEVFDHLICRSRLFGRDIMLVNDPAAARWVFGEGAANFRRAVASLRVIRPIAGAGLLSSDGEAWRRQRRLLAPVFSRHAIEPMLPHFQSAAEGLVERLKGCERANLAAALHATALDVVLRALFSTPEPKERDALARLVRRYLKGPGRPGLFDSFVANEEDFGWSLASRRRFGRDWAVAVDDLIARRRRQPGDGRGDLLDLLIAARDPQTGEGLPDAEIRDQCGTMLFAGHETTARLLFWACYLLTLDRNEQDRLRAESRVFAAGDAQRLSDLDRWPRQRLVLLETLRLYPPVPNILREAAVDTAIGDEPVQARTHVLVVPFILHRHHRNWDQPMAFLPDRFEGLPAPWTKGAFMPFGSGPRTCIGASFALASAQIVLASLLSRFELTLENPRPVLPVGRSTLAPDHEPWFRLRAV